MIAQSSQEAQQWALALVALGFAALLCGPFIARYHIRRRHLNERGARLAHLNLFYNGVATSLAGVFNLYGFGLGAWALLMSVPLLSMAISVATARQRLR